MRQSMGVLKGSGASAITLLQHTTISNRLREGRCGVGLEGNGVSIGARVLILSTYGRVMAAA